MSFKCGIKSTIYFHYTIIVVKQIHNNNIFIMSKHFGEKQNNQMYL